MNYEEAISELNHELSVGNIGVITRDNIAKALTYAQKEHELLGLYQKKEQCIVCVPVMKDSPILHCVVRYSEDEKYMRILNQIKALEEELKSEK